MKIILVTIHAAALVCFALGDLTCYICENDCPDKETEKCSDGKEHCFKLTAEDGETARGCLAENEVQTFCIKHKPTIECVKCTSDFCNW